MNKRTIKNSYPLPLISELIDSMGTKKVFTKMDLSGATTMSESRKEMNGRWHSQHT